MKSKAIFKSVLSNLLSLLALLIFINHSLHAETIEYGVVAKIDGRMITLDDIQNRAIYDIRAGTYSLFEMRLKEFVLLELQKKHSEYAFEPYVPTSSDIDQYYDNNGYVAYGPKNDPKVRGQIASTLMYKMNLKRLDDLFQKAVNEGLVTSYLKPPKELVFEVPLDDRRTEIGLTSKVALVEFIDYQCPYCQKAQGLVEKVKQIYPKLVHQIMHLPLDVHKQAYYSAMAFECARDQNKHKAFAGKLWLNPHRQTSKFLKQFAKEVSLNTSMFEFCFEKQKYRALVDRDLSVAQHLGINSTPTFIIGLVDRQNDRIYGEILSGLVDFESITTVIEKYQSF